MQEKYVKIMTERGFNEPQRNRITKNFPQSGTNLIALRLVQETPTQYLIDL